MKYLIVQKSDTKNIEEKKKDDKTLLQKLPVHAHAQFTPSFVFQ